ncbi:glycosyltransferase [Pseudidiomarina planktonica]|nr:glycosyltransferase [Pseudidiomarina planktonica]RUO65116.1 glycosyltransferase [Pseudidiomarina planktonica]
MSLTRMVDASSEFLLRFAASGYLPARWFYHAPPKSFLQTKPKPPEMVEIVAHCWQYSHLFVFQLQSLVNYPPTEFKVVFTGFYCEDDRKTVELIEHYRQMQIANVEWNFTPLSKEQLLRRAIGRNKAAKATQADWIWFTDCDVIFGPDTFPSLFEQLSGERSILVFPKKVSRTALLCKNDSILNKDCDDGVDLSVLETCKFKMHTFEKATGAVQIVAGDVARKYGYCEGVRCYQQPQERWVKTYEDRAFRWILGTHGKPLKIKEVSVIRHEEKGRYKKNTFGAKLRTANRRMKDRLFSR